MVLNRFHRKYEAGGLNLTAGDFSQLSEPKFLPRISRFVDDDVQLH